MKFYILMFAVAVVEISCLPSRQRRQFDWASWENNDNTDWSGSRSTRQWEWNQPSNQLGRQLPTNNLDIADFDPLGDAGLSTSTQGTTTTRASANYRRCFDTCQATGEYNPVCGTDGNTYQNAQRLRCASSCGQNVRLLRGGTCLPL